jgi:hypothetical protein
MAPRSIFDELDERPTMAEFDEAVLEVMSMKEESK